MFLIGLLIIIHVTWSSARQGACDETGPICGNDGKTYETMCQLIWARFEDTDLQVLHEGSCNAEMLSGLDPSKGEAFHTVSTPHAVASTHAKPTKHQKNSSSKHDKIKSIMPYGWPPLGPVVAHTTQLDKADQERNKRFHVKLTNV